MDRLAAALEKLAEGDKLDKAIGVLESAASKPPPTASHNRDSHRGDNETSPGKLQINEAIKCNMTCSFSEYL